LNLFCALSDYLFYLSITDERVAHNKAFTTQVYIRRCLLLHAEIDKSKTIFLSIFQRMPSNQTLYKPHENEKIIIWTFSRVVFNYKMAIEQQ
jgi:hypothetical protein